ncbi:uncharacterized protein LOC143885836 [Tasmannia lanceolata]|uniref:uncharacterized protein LOC143885836 n=1 Tax=Tasmannia lanceolata TaxID=3420 RepID=UPI0040644B78
MEQRRTKPLEDEFETINIGTESLLQEIKIGKTLSPEERAELIKLLKECKEVFAWSSKDMPGLSEKIVQHHIPLYPEAKPKKQKLRRMKPEWLLKIKDEVMNQLKADFLEVVTYPEWLANTVPVPKKDGRVRCCVDFRDLKKTSLKDDFPLPHIDILVDNTAGHALLSFMDGFSGYNQIKMAQEDKTKTTFTTQWGTYCYRVMPFDLKIAGATYQRAATTLLHDMIHKEVEVYVDNMIVKAKDRIDQIQTLRRFFERIAKYKLWLNPNKCVFKVVSEKLLGFLKSVKGRIITEQLADAPTEDTELSREFSDEGIMTIRDEPSDTTWTMYFDGASNSRGRGVGIVLVSPRDEHIQISIKLEFDCTNNIAEYEACIAGLEAALSLEVQDLDVYGDSLLIICQTNGKWLTKEDRLIPYRTYFTRLTKSFHNISFTYILRLRKRFVDALATLASMVDISVGVKVRPLTIK